MKYIKRITLNNFQSHKHSSIDLDERLNVIVGSSDSGKSAIIRGIKWVLYNEPSGDYFIREGEKECSVTLEFSDNTILKRYRSRSKNQYILINNKGEETKFEGFGSNTPEQIVETIGIKKIHLDSEESNSINLGEQLDGAFLLSEKSSTRASAIGRLVGVNIIDDALRDVLKDSRGLNIIKKNIEESNLRIAEEVKKYDFIDSMKEKLNIVSAMKNEISKNNIRLEKLKNAYKLIHEIKNERTEITNILNKLQVLGDLKNKANDIENNLLKHRYLSRYNINLYKIRKDVNEYRLISYKLKDIELAQNNVSQLENIYGRYRKLSQMQKKRALYIYEILQQKNTLIELNNIDKISDDLNKIPTILKKLNKLTYYRETYDNIKKSLIMGENYIINFKNVEKVDYKLDVLDEKLNLLTKLSKLYKVSLIYKKDLHNETTSFNDINDNIKIQLDKYQNLLKKIEVCPYCLSDISESKIEHIIDHYIGG
ncbi:AAA family ATPase [Tissierella sp. Yu-01]|uniref:AAA family ATPase n=1 Tax=Tissierella sp. Yu-01 TaxID=3035694 RepID=UPI00240D385A|nr:AAA family ATPase [Tissierella sp. Yu-01]WFA09744.1 AAA family ATPase [Tissierella sp. Yu-01]